MGFNLNLNIPFGKKKKEETNDLMGMKDDLLGNDLTPPMDNPMPSPSPMQNPMHSPSPSPSPMPTENTMPMPTQENPMPSPSPSPMPTQPMQQAQLPPDIDEKINELIEKYLEEKWQVVAQFLQDLKAWKNTVDNEIRELREEVTKLKARVDEIENGSQQKMNEVARTIMDLGAEIKAMERVLQQMLPDLVSSVRELSKIVSELKSMKVENKL